MGRLVVPDVYMIAASSSGSMSTPASSSDCAPTRPSNSVTPSGPVAVRASTISRSFGQLFLASSTWGSRSGWVMLITLSE